MQVNHLKRCQKCKHDVTWKFTQEVEGNIHAPILFIKEYPLEEECIQQKFFVTEAGKCFRRLLDFSLLKEMYAVTCLVHCSVIPKKVAARNCFPFLEPLLLKRKVIVCLGRNVLRYVFMRGASPPPMTVLLGRAVRPDGCASQVVTLPDVEELLTVEEPTNRYSNPAAELQRNKQEMEKGFSAITQIMREGIK